MKKKSLLQTNKYLRNPVTRKKILISSAIVSSRIEGIRVSKKAIQSLTNSYDKISKKSLSKPS